MNKRYTQQLSIFILFLLFTFPASLTAQEGNQQYSAEKIKEYEANVQNIIEFLEYSFNTLGNPKTTARDKDVIINQSYAKIFMDADVQIEDDLDDNRETLINKDVQAYLKDIDFFFREVAFSLNVSSIDHHFRDGDEIYFVVTLTRTLNGITIDGETVSSNKERFIEVNFNDIAQDLRIASIYTTKIDEKDEFFAWWNKMPTAWHELLGQDAIIYDTIKLSKVAYIDDTMAVAQYWGRKAMPVDTDPIILTDTLEFDGSGMVEGLISDTIILKSGITYRLLQRIASEKEIDISGNLNINSLEPLSQMGQLQKVNCSNTLIDDLAPLRNLINIEWLDCSGTAVTSIAPMQYSISLKMLDVSATRVSDIELLANLHNIEKINFSNTPVDSLDMLKNMSALTDLRFSNTFVSKLDPLQNLTNLRIIKCSGTYIKNIAPLQYLTELERLYMSNTQVSMLEPLSGLNNLQTIYIDSTNVKSLQPLNGLPKLEKIYCDNTGITSSKANKFMAENPKVLVVHESVALQKWWNSMSPAWQSVITKIVEVDAIPNKEQLHKAANITEINISGNKNINDLNPLKSLIYLSILDCSNTNADNLWPLADLVDLRTLNISGTKVSSCDPLRDLISLESLDISNTGITDIQCISRIKGLEELNIENTRVTNINIFGESNLHLVHADQTGVSQAEVIAFKESNPECTVLYQSASLQEWWNALSSAWQEVLSDAAGIKKTPNALDLQKIADLKEIDLSQRTGLKSLVPLQKLILLTSLKMSNTGISDLKPLAVITSLEILIISDNPVEDISPLKNLTAIKRLELENTPVDDLEALAKLTNLEILNLAGTQINKLNDLSTLTGLKQLSFYNTAVKSLSPLEDLLRLKMIKCYNTRLKEKKVKQFREARPGCEIIFY